ncbi:GntR family transcriptional regulator [Nakamurella antarctica]|uniref:GntR family transcriptional regulator n=1 Tax=Nakamurella antarctica TaxID=1902245 RepID=A0A3G8ZQL7_9ACTN|nr:GntR family transcriptional regulator [Nakamurella antarctica]AZI56844.1 GntR family transcriptional regulator [Nakamurella antarctica]
MARDSARRTGASPKRLVLADETYDAIKAMILDHEISPGEHVGIDELSRDLSVSQTPIREALARLEADGLVTKIPLRGYRATDLLSVQQFDELFQFRGLIEPWAAAEAARHRTRRDIAALEAELDRADHIPQSAATTFFAESVEHDTRLHTLVAQASGNAFVEGAFIRTRCHLHLFRVYKASIGREGDDGPGSGFVSDMFAQYYQSGQRPLAFAEHEAIVQAISASDSSAASALMLAHIESSRQRFTAAVEALNADD